MNQLSMTSMNSCNIEYAIAIFTYLYCSISFEGRKKRVGSKEKQEHDKLQHKIKREMKGAIREIRKDNAFIAREKLKEQIEKYITIVTSFMKFYERFTFLNFAETISVNVKLKNCYHRWPIKKEKSEK